MIEKIQKRLENLKEEIIEFQEMYNSTEDIKYKTYVVQMQEEVGFLEDLLKSEGISCN